MNKTQSFLNTALVVFVLVFPVIFFANADESASVNLVNDSLNDVDSEVYLNSQRNVAIPEVTNESDEDSSHKIVVYSHKNEIKTENNQLNENQ